MALPSKPTRKQQSEYFYVPTVWFCSLYHLYVSLTDADLQMLNVQDNDEDDDDNGDDDDGDNDDDTVEDYICLSTFQEDVSQ